MAPNSHPYGPAGAMPVADRPEQVRNVVLVGHPGVGRTSLVRALVTASGTVNGPTGDGTGRDPVGGPATRLHHTSLWHHGVKVNLLDPPGPDELRAVLRAADAALFVVSAVDGMDTSTAAGWEECAAVGLPRAVAVTGLDDPRADVDEAVALCQRVFGDDVLPLYLPMLSDDGTSVAGLLGLLARRVFDYTAGLPAAVRPPDPEHLPAVAEARDELVEGVLAGSEDETLLDRYLDGEEIDPEVLAGELDNAVGQGYFHPAVPVCPRTGVGLDVLLDFLTTAFPPSPEHTLPAVTGLDGAPRPPLTGDPDGPLVAEVVRADVDGHLGPVCLVRVFSGTLRAEQTVWLSAPGTADGGRPGRSGVERVGRVHSPLGGTLREVPYCVAGDLCVISTSGGPRAGDTVAGPQDPLVLVR